MPRRTVLIFLASALLALIPLTATAQTTTEGQTASGSYYKYTVPDGWIPANGLVIWNHGFSLNPIGPVTDLGPLVDLQLSEGYAVAASSYSLPGWAVFQTDDDLEQMYEAFSNQMGEPSHTLITGASLGGAVTVRAIESAELGNVVGAMPICGAVAGSRLWNAAVDLRLLYDFVCEGVPEAAIPGGSEGLPIPGDPTYDPNFDQNAMAAAVNACTGILAPPEFRTPDQVTRLNTLLGVAQIPENFLLTDMGFVTFGLVDLIHDPRKLGGAPALGNREVDYGDPLINLGIRRADGDPLGALLLKDNYTPTGQVGDVKIISIHTDKDGLVLVENESEYAEVVPPSQLTTGIIVEDVPSHCGFTSAETVAAWESLRGWVAGLPQPNVAALQATCEGIAAGGLADGPCRYDPNFVVPDMDTRVRPRTICQESNNVLCLMDDRFKVEVDWTDFRNHSGPGWVSNARTEESGSFFFFNADNLELTVKALDGRGNNGHFWVFYGSLTNVEFEMTVTDTVTGLKKTYTNEAGNFASVGDTSAF